ncbi:hypothetical protein HVA01_33790 [Halovibrio variabilis]|uniref:Uncharacterized protein n=1 Tax=Halovibrio variabilis TaxID=31910 RepID=A0A511UWA5_9GAMM|nr:hypothetical protein HVA01_33790 [Halovibrio variabilis]
MIATTNKAIKQRPILRVLGAIISAVAGNKSANIKGIATQPPRVPDNKDAKKPRKAALIAKTVNP